MSGVMGDLRIWHSCDQSVSVSGNQSNNPQTLNRINDSINNSFVHLLILTYMYCAYASKYMDKQMHKQLSKQLGN